ncbi:MAG: UPF0175 family protein [Candidatus Bipolaricaulota bacterium]|nr:UPF0175 family protein [Candidatus Bipolaricaulota bacterium]
MALKRVEVELPEELWKLAGIPPKDASAKFQEMVVMELLRQGKLSHGKAAEILKIDRWRLMDLMAAYQVPVSTLTSAELAAELKHLRRRRAQK